MASKKDNVLFIEPGNSFEDGATFTIRENGGLTISVAEEQAVGSFNEEFECTITMEPEKAAVLRDWLNKHFPTS